MIHSLGTSHRLIGVDGREVFSKSLPSDEELVASGRVTESVTLTTCNRHETIVVTEHVRELERDFRRRLGPHAGALIVRSGPEAVRHLFRVAASIESLVVGETQILGQVRRAEESAVKVRTIGPYLRRLFVEARRIGGEVRRKTALGAGTVSVASVAVKLATRVFGALDDCEAIVLGTGEMGRIVAEHLAAAKAKITVVSHRNVEGARALADLFGAACVSWNELPARLAAADIVVSSTSSPVPVLTRELVAAAMRRRAERMLFLADIAVPRDIDPAADSIQNVYLYDLDDLDAIALEHRHARSAEIAKAERIVEDGLARWGRAAREIALRPVVAAAYERLLGIEARSLAELTDDAERRALRLRLRHFFHFARKTLSTDDELDRTFRLEGFKALFGIDGATGAEGAEGAAGSEGAASVTSV
jgi:glutamyl-tRNA reductase